MATTTLAILFSLSINRDLSLSVIFSPLIVAGFVVLVCLIFAARFFFGRGWKLYEVDEAELGIGNQKIILKPNLKDREVAYKIWVELSTRKIGLPIDLNNDVISEVYDSWYNFFSITRELIKDIPVSKLQSDSTRKLIDLSIGVLNDGLRPHLTHWQARFRKWYEKELRDSGGDFDPQVIQAKYPHFEELKSDLLMVNDRLVKYREKMKGLILNKRINIIKGKTKNKPSLSN